jgi:hypothetical protein
LSQENFDFISLVGYESDMSGFDVLMLPRQMLKIECSALTPANQDGK